MSKKITGAEYPLAKIFSSDFDYSIPSYQRPYAWTEVQAGAYVQSLKIWEPHVVEARQTSWLELIAEKWELS